MCYYNQDEALNDAYIVASYGCLNLLAWELDLVLTHDKLLAKATKAQVAWQQRHRHR